MYWMDIIQTEAYTNFTSYCLKTFLKLIFTYELSNKYTW